MINPDAFDQDRNDLARQLSLLDDDEPYEKTEEPTEEPTEADDSDKDGTR